MPVSTVSVARSLPLLAGAADICGSVVRSVAGFSVVHEPSDDGGASGIADARAEGAGWPLLTGELPAGSGTCPSGMVCIFRVLNGSFTRAAKGYLIPRNVARGRLLPGLSRPRRMG